MVGVANDLNDIMLKSNFHTGKYSSENVRIKVKKYLHLSRKNPVVHTHTKEKEINRVEYAQLKKCFRSLRWFKRKKIFLLNLCRQV